MEAILLPILIAIAISIASLTHFIISYGRAHKLPPSPPSWPLFGHLPLLSQRPLHRCLHRLSLSYGPVFLLQLGSFPTVVISSAQMAKHFLHSHDEDFLDRPSLEANKRLLYGNKGMIFMEHGPRWRELRRMYTLQLLTVKKIQMFKHVRTEEISSTLRSLEQQSNKGDHVVDVNKLAFSMVGNILTRMLFSKQAFGSEVSTFKDMFLEMNVLFGVPLIGDVISCLRWLDVPRYKKRMDNLAQRLDAFLEDILEERMRNKREEGGEVSALADVLDVLIDTYKGDDKDSKDWIKSGMLEMLGAGVDTSSTTIEWAMTELLRNPSSMTKLQQEMDSVIGPLASSVQEEDIPKLEYLQAVVKETLRLHPPFPLMLRQMTKSKKGKQGVGEYMLPEKTRLIVNLWAMGRDASVWGEACNEFKPERFIKSSIDVRGHDFELIPFGSGKRVCPGMNLALCIVPLVVANLVYNFHWRLPQGVTPLSIDMSEAQAIGGPKSIPLMACATPSSCRTCIVEAAY